MKCLQERLFQIHGLHRDQPRIKEADDIAWCTQTGFSTKIHTSHAHYTHHTYNKTITQQPLTTTLEGKEI